MQLPLVEQAQLLRSIMRPFFYSLLLLAFSHIVSADPLKVGIVDFPPLFVVEGGKVVGGSVVETMEKTLKNASLNYQLLSFPAKRTYVNLGSGIIDLHGGLKRNVNYHDQVIYSKNLIGAIELRIYGLGDTSLPVSLTELTGKRLGIIRGFNYNGYLATLTDPNSKNHVTVINSHSSALLMLQNGRIDLLLDYKSPVDSELQIRPIAKIRHNTLEKLDLYFVLNKNRPNAVAIMNLLDASFSSLFPGRAKNTIGAKSEIQPSL